MLLFETTSAISMHSLALFTTELVPAFCMPAGLFRTGKAATVIPGRIRLLSAVHFGKPPA
jgi:hypothetical protein